MLGEHRVPQGAMGRVVATHGAGDALELEVQIVGVGRVRYARRELTPRKLGQLRFAARRAEAWDALRPCVVLEATVGSRAWGLADEGSDVDTRGIFVPPFAWTTGIVAAPEELVSADGSATFWGAAKAIRQLLRADPNTLELLFVDGVRPLDPIGAWLLAGRDAFVSAEIYGSFGRYALSQLAKLRQALRLAEHRAIVLGWLREEPPPELDALADRLAAATASTPLAAKEYVKQLYRSLYDQGLLPERDLSALTAFARRGGGDGDGDGAFELPRELRPKNAYNLLRLIATAIGWLRTGAPDFVARGALRDRLRAIKRGEVPLDEVLRDAEALTPELEAARQETRLPPRADLPAADALLRRIHEEAARRFLDRAPGPLGRDAPPPPDVHWEEEPPP
jgi:hypothetical protein